MPVVLVFLELGRIILEVGERIVSQESGKSGEKKRRKRNTEQRGTKRDGEGMKGRETKISKKKEKEIQRERERERERERGE